MNDKILNGLREMNTGMYIVNEVISSLKDTDRFLLDILNGNIKSIKGDTQLNYFFKSSFDEEYYMFEEFVSSLTIDTKIEFSLKENNTINCLEGLNLLFKGINTIINQDKKYQNELLSIKLKYNPFRIYGLKEFQEKINKFTLAYQKEINLLIKF